jgi:hypothetical protein
MPDIVFLNFAQYVKRSRLIGITDDMFRMERELGLSPLHFYGYGPAAHEISEYIR